MRCAVTPASEEGAASTQPTRDRAIIDYEGSTYEQDFWGGGSREYEDRVERIALRQLLPKSGHRLLEIGAGYGRLTREYDAFDSVVLMDYSLSHLQAAQQQLGRAPRYTYVAADVYALPFAAASFDTVTLIRVLHHLVDAPAALREVARVSSRGSRFILEYANARNLKAMLRYALRRQAISPYRLEPTEFVPLNFDFHPRYISEALSAVGFRNEARRPVSYFRLGLLKRALPTHWLAAADALLQRSGVLYSPSVFTRNYLADENAGALTDELEFCCPRCQEHLERVGDSWRCHDGSRYAIHDGIHDFRAPLA